MALGLHRPVVVALLKGETAHQRANGAVVRIQGYQCALHGGHLAEFVAAVGLRLYANQITDLGDIRRLFGHRPHAVGVEELACPFHGVPGDVRLTGASQYLNAILVDLGHDGRFKTADRALLGQFLSPYGQGLARQA